MAYEINFHNSEDNLWYKIGPINAYAEAMTTFNRLSARPEVSKVDMYSTYTADNVPIQSYQKKK